MSQNDGDTKTIDGETFRVLMLDPLVANDLLIDIGKVLGPAVGAVGASLLKADDTQGMLAQLMDGVKKSAESVEDVAEGLSVDGQKTVKDLIGDSLERALLGLIDRIEKHKLREMIDILQGVSSVKKGEEWPALSSVSTILFRGRIKLMYKWLGFAIRVQFKDFF